MATIIWCDRKQHIVQEPRTTVEQLLGTPEAVHGANSFVYVTPVNSETQRALRVSAITSFEAVPGDGI